MSTANMIQRLKAILLFLLITVIPLKLSQAQQLSPVPEFGAQVFIEPGQTAVEIDHWFQLLEENNMKLCRIRMFETYMHKEDGSWDFTLFDHAFISAEKHGIKIFATLFPATPFMDVGGFKFPRTAEHQAQVADYIKNVTTHFKRFPSLFGWVLINEPGSGSLPNTDFTKSKFDAWKTEHPTASFNTKGYPVVGFEKERFLVDYNTWYLNWLATEVRKYDPDRHLHVNNHAIFQNIAEYNFPEWRKFLTSLGGSAHASWHFGYFSREKYSVAMSANCEIIRSGAGNLPWLMTEIQGGNNTYSGFNAMCPTKEEIAQWMWTIVGSGGKGGIFWTLNPRASGLEAGEWAMIDFLDQPSDRLTASKEVLETINKNNPLFSNCQPVESNIHILYTRESLWVEKMSQTGGKPYEGRDLGGVMKSALGYFETLGEMGIPCHLNEIDEFDFSKDNYEGSTIILAHQIAIPSKNWKNLEEFVSKGGKLIVDGLTAFFDESAHNIMKTGFPLENLFGGKVKEFKLVDNLFDFKILASNLKLQASTWRGTLQPTTGKVMATFENEVTAVRNTFGKGEVVWIPSLLGLGARITDYKGLSGFLYSEASKSIASVPIRLQRNYSAVMMKTLKTQEGYISVLINKNSAAVDLDILSNNRTSKLLFANKGGKVAGNKVHLFPEETIVVYWK